MSSCMPSLHAERGSAIVELALLLPLFVMLLFWAVYFTEFSLLRIRQQEVSRFLTWESAAHSLADFQSGRHAPQFEAMRKEVLTKAEARYQNLEGHNLSSRPTTWMARPKLQRMELHPLSLGAGPTDSRGHEVLGEVEKNLGADSLLPSFRTLIRGLEGSLDTILGSMRFPELVGVRTTVELEIENTFVPGDESIFLSRIRRITLSPADGHLETETWALEDGGDVGLADGDHPFTRQVDRLAFLGAGEMLERAFKYQGFVRDLFPFPPTVRVLSQRYGEPALDPSRLDCRGEALSATGKWRNGPKVGTVEDTISPAKCFDTLPMEANGLGAGYEGDPSYRQLRARHEGYMGCAAEGGCDGL